MNTSVRARVCFQSLLAFSLIVFPGSAASARIVVAKNPLDGVLDAQLVVIVRQQEALKLFQIDEVFLGNAQSGDSLDVGDLELSTEQESGPPTVDPITPETRILLYLQRNDTTKAWEPTDFKHSVFWGHTPGEITRLRETAKRTVELRREWERAASVVDPRQRVEALWPFLALRKYGVSFLEHTKAELKKAKPVSGEYFAERFDQMSLDQSGFILVDAADFGSDVLHDKLISHLREKQRVYSDFVAKTGKIPEGTDWDTLPASIKDVNGEIYYTFAALDRFRDRRDLPLIRDVALWAVHYHLEQTAEEALMAFRWMPDQANLSVIDLIDRQFPARPGNNLIYIEAARALCAHKYVETVPLLAPFLSDDFLRSEVNVALWDIVGLDLGGEPKPWLDWYALNTQR